MGEQVFHRRLMMIRDLFKHIVGAQDAASRRRSSLEGGSISGEIFARPQSGTELARDRRL